MSDTLRYTLGIMIVGYGILVSLAIIAVVVYDLTALRKGWRTVSRECMYLGQSFPWFAALTGSTIGLVAGMLIGHLFLGQWE